MRSHKSEAIPKVKSTELDAYLFGDDYTGLSPIYDRFHITRMKDYKDKYVFPIHPHRRSVYHFVFLYKGKAVRTKNLNTYSIHESQTFCMPAKQITSIEMVSDDVEGFYCHFRPELFIQNQINFDLERTFPFFEIAADPIINIKDSDKINQLLLELHQEYMNYSKEREKIISLLLTRILHELNFDHIKSVNISDSAAFRVTQDYKGLLSEKLEEVTKVADYAHLLNISPNHLNKSVKEATGYSAHQILSEMRILQAKVFLKQTDMPIKEIAYRIGDFNSSEFGKLFKRKTGSSPSSYRKRFFS